MKQAEIDSALERARQYAAEQDRAQRNRRAVAKRKHRKMARASRKANR